MNEEISLLFFGDVSMFCHKHFLKFGFLFKIQNFTIKCSSIPTQLGFFVLSLRSFSLTKILIYATLEGKHVGGARKIRGK